MSKFYSKYRELYVLFALILLFGCGETEDTKKNDLTSSKTIIVQNTVSTDNVSSSKNVRVADNSNKLENLEVGNIVTPKNSFTPVKVYIPNKNVEIKKITDQVQNISSHNDIDFLKNIVDPTYTITSDVPLISTDIITSPKNYKETTLNDKIKELQLDNELIGELDKSEWKYFKVKPSSDMLLNISLTQLTDDVDLYVKKGNIPTRYDYDCRSNNANNTSEVCVQNVTSSDTYYVGIFSREFSEFKIIASHEKIKTNKVVLLLHGLASEPSTWKDLYSDDQIFNGSCEIININDNYFEKSLVNKNGVSCYTVKFGSFDTNPELSTSGLDGRSCNVATGCNGDFSSFKLLGDEVDKAIEKIIKNLGDHTEVILLGHSRGGLAAREYLQNPYSHNKKHILGLITTGTPHQGSPLGRFYKYMEDNCTPKSSYRQDNSVCEDSWEVIEMLEGTRTFFGFNYNPEKIIDLQAPSIDFLSPESDQITDLNKNLYELPEVVTAELSYSGAEFGVLKVDSPSYNLYDYQRLFHGDHPHPSTLRYIEQGHTKESYQGDGIVPVYSQKLSNLLVSNDRKVDISSQIITKNIIHTKETSQITDIYKVLTKVYSLIGWEDSNA